MSSVIQTVTTCGLPAAIQLVRPGLRPLIRADARTLTAATAAAKPVMAPTRNAVILNPMKLTVLAAQRLAETAAAARVPAVRHVRSRKNRNRHRTNPIRYLLTPENRKTTAIPVPALPAQPAKAAQSAKLTLPMPAAQWYVPNVTIPIPVPGKVVRPVWPAARKAVLLTAPKQIAALRFAPNATK